MLIDDIFHGPEHLNDAIRQQDRLREQFHALISLLTVKGILSTDDVARIGLAPNSEDPATKPDR